MSVTGQGETDDLLGGVEAGGTKFVCVVGDPDGAIVARERIATTDPAGTLAATVSFFQRQRREGRPVTRIGVASFGPLELRPAAPRYGQITATPKPGWRYVDIAGWLARALGVPVAIDTDVNGAALAEGTWGAARGVGSYVYLTLGTGIGGGAVIDGRVVHGLVHPEMGHLVVPRAPGDDHVGSCPFHGDCLEGMACGPALAARFGRPAAELGFEEAARAADLVAFYLGSGLRTIVYTLAPQRIVIGGGLASLPSLLELTRARLASSLAGYPGLPEHETGDLVVAAELGGDAGPRGALLLAARSA